MKYNTMKDLRNNMIYGIKHLVYRRFGVPYVFNGVGNPSPDYDKWFPPNRKQIINEMEDVANQVYRAVMKNIKRPQNLDIDDRGLYLEVQSKDGLTMEEVFRY